MRIPLNDFGGREVARVIEVVDDVLVKVVFPVLKSVCCCGVVFARAVLVFH
jgi:hypothetical protein